MRCKHCGEHDSLRLASSIKLRYLVCTLCGGANRRSFWQGVWVYLGFGSVPAICVWRDKFDRHDYPIKKGGDGHPSHFHTYRCYVCQTEFTI